MAGRKCRIWWPEWISSHESGAEMLLFGWFIDSVTSIDVVVAATASPCEVSLRLQQSDDLQEILHSANKRMPMLLQEFTTFSILGHCASNWNYQDLKAPSKKINVSLSKSITDQLLFLGEDVSMQKFVSCGSVNKICNQEAPGVIFNGNCGCKKLDQFLEPYRLALIGSNHWIQLSHESPRNLFKEIRVPLLQHIHLNGHLLPISDVHLIIYELPMNAKHHFALSTWRFTKTAGTFKKPNWIEELQYKPVLPDLDKVVLAINCANAAKICIDRSFKSKKPATHFRCKFMLASVIWHMVAFFAASLSTFIYILLQFFHRSLNYGSQSFLITMLGRIFGYTWRNVHIRSCQFMYWPIYLRGSGFSSQSNVEYAHEAALKKHFFWSSIAMDVLLGNVLGVALLVNLDAVCSWVLFVVHYLTDNLLRSGCVWLTNVPAGFKLNDELASFLGVISLNSIQTYSTLWFFLRSLLRYLVEGIAFSGILLGLTIPSALCKDMLKLSTLHVSSLHWLISFMCSQQIQALASLWRLFRGRKWNPLRQRLDSYDCTVEQHVVGSLLFTPVLILLPTTSVFYIFFTSLNNSISLICIIIEVMVSILHGTPYAEIILWITSRRRFPSGIWLETMSSSVVSSSASNGLRGGGYLPSDLDKRKSGLLTKEGPKVMTFRLCSNYATIGQVVAPYYRNVFSRVSPSFCTSWAYGVLRGQRSPSTLQTALPPTLPWMNIGCREYWRLCHSSVLSCRQ